jgi:hypothetical protein
MMIKQAYYRQQLYKAKQQIPHNHEKVAYYSQKIVEITKQFS